MTSVPSEAAMTDADKAVIRAFAAGDESLRSKAIEIHRRYIPALGVRGTPEQRFMSEVDHPCPDAFMRSMYRKDILA